MRQSKIFFVLESIIMFLGLNCCDVDKLELVNPNEITPETYFKTEDQVQKAVNAVYATMQTPGLYQRTIFFAMDNIDPVSNKEQPRIAIEHERKIELCSEQVRFNDLVRWRRLEAFIQEVLPGVVKFRRDAVNFDPAKHYLWPIPQREMDINSAIADADQNPGY